MFHCSVCAYESNYKFNVDRHEKAKHFKPMSTTHSISNDATHQTGSGTEQTAPSHSPNEKHSNLQEESVDQLYENIDQWQKAYNKIKLL